MPIGITRYFHLMMGDALGVTSLDGMQAAVKQYNLPIKVPAKATLSNIINGSGHIPDRNTLKTYFANLIYVWQHIPTWDPNVPGEADKAHYANLLRITDAARDHLETVFIDVEEARRRVANTKGEPRKAHIDALDEWCSHLDAWCDGLMPSARRQETFRQIFLSLLLSEVCFDLVELLPNERHGELMICADKALGRVSTLLKRVDEHHMTRSTLIRAQSNKMVAIGTNVPYAGRFGYGLLVSDWEDFDFKTTIDGGLAQIWVSTMMIRNLIELAMYVHLENQMSPVPDRLKTAWDCFDLALEQSDSKHFGGGRRDLAPKNWPDGVPSIQADPDLAPYVRWHNAKLKLDPIQRKSGSRRMRLTTVDDITVSGRKAC